MDSINRQQPEENRADLTGSPAVDRVRKMVDDATTCFFCTEVETTPTGGTRPMSVRRIDEAGTLWFLSARDSHKNLEISRDPAVRLYFQGSKHSEFLFLRGRASVLDDKAKIAELWSPLLKTWFTEGIDDPRITVIRVTPADGYYWDNKHGSAVAGIKMVVGAALGKTLDDSIEGTLDVGGKT